MEKGNTLDVIRQCFVKVLTKNDARMKISSIDFIATLVFCFFGDSKVMSLESMRRWMIEKLAKSLAKSSFWERLSRPRLKNMLYDLLATIMAKLATKAIRGKDILSALVVTKILLIDSSSISLWHGASEEFPGTRTTAGIKWHCCFDLFLGRMTWFKMTPTSTNDRKCFPPMDLIRGALMIFDLGYWDYGLFLAIENANAFFLSRIKRNAVITINGVIQGISKRHIGKKLTALKFKKRSGLIVELVGTIVIKKVGYDFRVIGFWNPTEKIYHWYLTNLKVPAMIIYPLYRIRWTLELVFKSCKQSLNANQIPSTHTNIIEGLLLASLIAHLASYSIFDVAIEGLDEEEILAISVQRIGKIAVLLASDFIYFLIYRSKKARAQLVKKILLFASELFDPNYRHRKTILQQLELAINKGSKNRNIGKIIELPGKKNPSNIIWANRKAA